MWQQLGLASELESDLWDTVDWRKRRLVDFCAGKTQLVSFDWSSNTGAFDVKMDGCVVEEKPYFKMLPLTFSSKLDWGSYGISTAKMPPFGALIRYMKFLSPEVAMYLYKSTIHRMLLSCLGWMDKLWKWICSSVGLSRATSLEHLAHQWSQLKNFL